MYCQNFVKRYYFVSVNIFIFSVVLILTVCFVMALLKVLRLVGEKRYLWQNIRRARLVNYILRHPG